VRITFADFTLDTAARQLLRGDRDLHLSPKAFDLLSILVAHRPNVVDKETLRDKLWPGTNVVDANLNNLASEIRSVLDDDPQQPRFLRTVHRVGYAFVGVKPGSDQGQTGVRHGSDPGQTPGHRVWLTWNERQIVLTGEYQVLGRDPKCEVWIDAVGVSRRHARISIADVHDRQAPIVTLQDLGSTNGTMVDGKPVKRSVTLEDGQSIQLGDATLTLRIWSEAGAPTKRIRRRS
jgi:DNA-binding winged helix-turn-helix (wHTH) protein